MRIVRPCGEDWEAMRGDGAVRFCERCQRSVTDLDVIEVEDVRALLLRGDACVRGRVDPLGRLLRVVALASAGLVSVGAPSAAPGPEAPATAPANADIAPATTEIAPVNADIAPTPPLSDAQLDRLTFIGYVD